MTSDKLSVMDTQGFQNASTAIAGFGDSASMNVSKNVRQALGSSGVYAICEDSGYYIAGGIAGDLATLPLGGGARVGVKTVTTGAKLSKETTTVVKTVDKPNVTNFTDDTSQDTMSCLLQNSFVAGTKVLLADGSSKNIEDVKVGDKVTATDPKTGKTEGKEVTKLIRHSGEHDMVKVTLSDGQVIDSTDEHPFWSVNKQDWVNAEDLVTGDQVLTNTGEKLFVTSIKTYTADLIAYNFTVANYHTYYVSADSSYILVHNASKKNQCNIISLQSSEDWITKGAHIKIEGNHEIHIFIDEEGSLAGKGLPYEGGIASNKQISSLLNKLRTDKKNRSKFIKYIDSATENLENGSWKMKNSDARISELKTLSKYLKGL